MKILHIANTDFEFELESPSLIPLELAWEQHPFCLQLQFLPLLYAGPDEGVAVSSMPDPLFISELLNLKLWKEGDLPKIIPFNQVDQFPKCPCSSWGASPRIQKWAHDRSLKYAVPAFDIVREINSKAFTHLHGFHLPESTLVENEGDLIRALKLLPIKAVLKSCFGVSGKGHRFIDANTNLQSTLRFCQKQWEKGLPLILEPWLDRILDFSTQWTIDQMSQIVFQGSTVFKTDHKGGYQSTVVGCEKKLFGSYLPFLEEHKEYVQAALTCIAKKGYFGPVGIDALLYRSCQGSVKLYPLVEINGRQTMSLAALKFQKKWMPKRSIELLFLPSQSSSFSLIPQKLCMENGKVINFKRKLFFRDIDPLKNSPFLC